MELAATIERIKQVLSARRLQSEAAVRQSVVLPILRALGWDDLNPDRVTPEFELGPRRVDYALSTLGSQPSLFIEVKGPGPIIGVEKQLFEYAFHVGIPFAILTNGQEWNFFLPAAPGSYDERLLYKLDLTERQTAEAVERLSRYVAFERVRSGEALKDAYSDYDDLHSKRVVRDALPRAWEQLLGEPDELLVDLVAERTASICGFRPSLELVAEFLGGTGLPPSRRGQGMARVPTRSAAPPTLAPEPTRASSADAGPQPSSRRSEPLRYTFRGETLNARSANEVLLHVVRTLAKRDPAFLDRFAREAPTKRRNHIARTAEEVYPGRPQLVKYVVELAPGWYIGTNVSNRDKIKLLQTACKVGGLRFGTDLIVELPNTNT